MAKILLVEDDKSLREIYGVRLMAEGYEIVSAGDGEEALALAIKERPDLIVSDVMMPKISGFDMLDILRSTTETRDVKVIMMTALSSDDQRARGESLGADRYLVKSQVGIEDVVRTVHEVLADSTPAAAPAPAPTFPSAASVTPEAPVTPAPAEPAASVGTLTDVAPAPAPVFETPLPQPTAPFSSPAPASLGEQFTAPAPAAPEVAPQPQAAATPAPNLTTEPVAQPVPAAPVATDQPHVVPQIPPAPVPTPTPVAPPAPVAPFQAPAPLENPVAPAPEPAFTPPVPSAQPTPPALDFSAQMEQALNETEPTPPATPPAV